MGPNYIEPAFRDRAPRLGLTAEGADVLLLGDQELTDNGPGRQRVKVGATGAISARDGAVSVWIKYHEGPRGGFDPHARIVDMDAEAIDAAFLYPSLGLFLGAIADLALAAATSMIMCGVCERFPHLRAGLLDSRGGWMAGWPDGSIAWTVTSTITV